MRVRLLHRCVSNYEAGIDFVMQVLHRVIFKAFTACKSADVFGKLSGKEDRNPTICRDVATNKAVASNQSKYQV